MIVRDVYRKKIGEFDISPGADLRRANLYEADLRGANLCGANLSGTKVAGVLWPAPTMVLLAQWSIVSKELCIELMRYDASNHPQPELFDKWARGGVCPYNDFNFERCANFTEVREWYAPGPAKSALWLAQELIKERCDLEPFE